MVDDVTLTPTEKWLYTLPEVRLGLIQDFLNRNEKYLEFKILQAAENGHLVFSVEQDIPVNERSTVLLGLEEELKKSVDEGLTVWLEPMGDKSKLRQLRGVEVKS